MTTPDDLSRLRSKPFSEAVTRLEDLLTQNTPIFLIGAGCSKCAGLPLTAELTESALASDDLDGSSKEILEAVQEHFSGSGSAHIEDYLSELIDYIAILNRREKADSTNKSLRLGAKQYGASELRNAVEQIKHAVAREINREINIKTHRSFVSSIHRPLRPGKATPTRTVTYLVLNYDTAIEDALAMERISFADGLDGGPTAWWNPRTFDRADLAARVLKLHGSITWIEIDGDPLPRRLAPSIGLDTSEDHRVLIWPASTKYRETQRDPYAQLLERARGAMRPALSTQSVLTTCGYSFGDSHINIEIDRALHESKGNLTLVAFTSEDEPGGQLGKWTGDPHIRDQILVFAKKGFFHAGTAHRSPTDLPWWKFENIVRLIGGER